MARLSENALATLDDLAATGTTGLRVRCLACARETILPMADLLVQHGGAATAVRVAERMCCAKCGGRPAWWWERKTSSGTQQAYGYPKG
ncbi:MAG: hypothetical protein O9320_08640 [Magnetospirillum sp.]|nr:hypothetical protein [Magnetospirillum sp.]